MGVVNRKRGAVTRWHNLLTCTKRYKIAMGMMTMRNIGKAMETAIMVLKTINRVVRKVRRERGRVSSMIFTSLENLLRMRPRGVVSKKDIGVLRMLSSILLWRVLEAKKPAMARAKVDSSTKMA